MNTLFAWRNVAALLIYLTLSGPAWALTISPAPTSMTVNSQLNFTVSGAAGNVLWASSRGQIIGSGAQITFKAPALSGTVWLIAVDDDSYISHAIEIKSPLSTLDASKATWQTYSNRSSILSLLPSKNGDKLWVATSGGLELRETQTGRLIRLYNNLDGLPGLRIQALLPLWQQDDKLWSSGLWVGTDKGLAQINADGNVLPFALQQPRVITALASDGAGGLLIATELSGLIRIDANKTITIFDTSNSSLPSNAVYALLRDAQGVWIGTGAGLARLDQNGISVFNRSNAGLPMDKVQLLAQHIDGGIWLGSTEITSGLVYFNAKLKHVGELNTTNSQLPSNYLTAVVEDASGGTWIGTGGGYGGGLAYRREDQTWALFNQDNTGLSSMEVDALHLDAKGGVWVGTFNGGLARITPDGKVNLLYAGDSNSLPSNDIFALESDGQGGIWIGTNPNTGIGGLAHLSSDGKWEVYTTDNSGLPSNAIEGLLSDGAGGVWISTYDGGLAHLTTAGQWQVFTTANSGILANQVHSLVPDNAGGVWMATPSGLSRVLASGAWEQYTTNNSALPGNQVTSLLSDGQGGVWTGTASGLAFRTPSNGWAVYNTSNTGILSNQVNTVLSDGKGGLWVGTDSGLSRFNQDGSWDSFTQVAEAPLQARNSATDTWLNSADAPGLPVNQILALFDDGHGGIWIGTVNGLVHRAGDTGKWTVYHVRNSGLASNEIVALESDGRGGVWIATKGGGLAHLSFGNRAELLNNLADSSYQDKLLNGKRAALIIHPNGQGSGYSQADAVDFMAGYAYQSIYARGYDHDEIYFLSYRPDLDVNADGQADPNVVDGPVSLTAYRNGTAARDLSVADIDAAFAWATAQGALDEPLLVVFIDHGLPNQLLLNATGSQTVSVEALKAKLDAYQTSTGNKVVVVLEACHTGTFVPGLQGENRIVVSSTNTDLAYYDDAGRTSFIKLYFDNLRLGETYWQAWQTVRSAFRGYRSPLNRQDPQLNDASNGNLAKAMCLNGCFGSLPGILTLTVETNGATVNPGQAVDLAVKTSLSDTSVNSVWASVMTPQVASQRNAQGYSEQPAPVVSMRLDSENTWRGRFSDFDLKGDYIFSFKAEDSTGFVTESAPLTFSVDSGETLQNAYFEASSGRLIIPALAIATAEETVLLHVEFILKSSGNPLIFSLDLNKLLIGSDKASYSNFDLVTFSVFIPMLDMPNALGGIDTYSATLNLHDPALWDFSLSLDSLKVQ